MNDIIPERIKKELKELLDRKNFFPALDKLKHRLFNDNYDFLKQELEQLHSREEIRQKFNLTASANLKNDKMKFITTNKIFKHLFENDMIGKIVNMCMYTNSNSYSY